VAGARPRWAVAIGRKLKTARRAVRAGVVRTVRLKLELLFSPDSLKLYGSSAACEDQALPSI
jgi:hypothetical protein